MHNRTARIFIFAMALLSGQFTWSAPPQFVILVELSTAMASRKEATARTIHDLVFSGFHERIRPDESFAVWFYDQAIRTNSPLAWNPDKARELANRAAASLQGRIYRPTQRIDQALAELAARLPNSPTLTTLILTSGQQPIIGAPNVETINPALVAHREFFAAQGKPFLVTYLARDGKWLIGSVHTNLLSRIELPEFPPEKTAFANAIDLLRSADLTPKKAEKTEPEAVVEKPKPEPRIIRETKAEPVAIAPVAIETPAPPPVEKPKPEPAPSPPPIAAPIAQVIEEVVVEKPTPVVPVKTEPPRTAPVVQQAVVVPIAPFPWPILLATFGMIAAAGAFAYLRIKSRPKPPGSIISQSLPDPAKSRHQKW